MVTSIRTTRPSCGRSGGQTQSYHASPVALPRDVSVGSRNQKASVLLYQLCVPRLLGPCGLSMVELRHSSQMELEPRPGLTLGSFACIEYRITSAAAKSLAITIATSDVDELFWFLRGG